MNESSIDRILQVIDAGLQTPVPDPSFGEISPTVHDQCVRCQRRDCVEGSDWCEPCRAFLLGDEPDPNPDPCPGGEFETWLRGQIEADYQRRLIGVSGEPQGIVAHHTEGPGVVERFGPGRVMLGGIEIPVLSGELIARPSVPMPSYRPFPTVRDAVLVEELHQRNPALWTDDDMEALNALARRVTAALEQIVPLIQQFLDQLGCTVREAVAWLSDALEGFAAIDQPPAAPRVDVRPAHARSCPRHGPLARGGRCLACERGQRRRTR